MCIVLLGVLLTTPSSTGDSSSTEPTVFRCIKAAGGNPLYSVWDLAEGRCVKKDSPLIKLSPILGDDGLVRVGGRLDFSELPYEERHPVVLPKGSRVSNLLLDRAHRSVGHQG